MIDVIEPAVEPPLNPRPAKPNSPGISIAGGTLVSASVASLMTIALLGTMAITNGPESMVQPPMPDSGMKPESMDIDQDNQDYGRQFVKRKLQSLNPSFNELINSTNNIEKCKQEEDPKKYEKKYEDPDDIDFESKMGLANVDEVLLQYELE